jgi:hypothetical protein
MAREPLDANRRALRNSAEAGALGPSNNRQRGMEESPPLRREPLGATNVECIETQGRAIVAKLVSCNIEEAMKIAVPARPIDHALATPQDPPPHG